MIIDRSLEDLYRRHLANGARAAADLPVSAQTKLANGTPWHALCTEVSSGDYDLVVVGRFGMHRGRSDTIGSNAARVAERSQSNVLIVGGTESRSPTPPAEPAAVPAEDLPALVWTEAARERLTNIPSFARPMAVLVIERYARENDLSTITPEVMTGARKKTGL